MTAKWERKYRSRYEIIAAIVESASKPGRTKMHLMFDAYLSYTQINRDYLPLLLGAGLLLGHADGYYTATEKGMRFLRMYDEIRDTAESKTRK